MALTLNSPAFESFGQIPGRFTRLGSNTSPPLQWSGAPGDSRSFALIVEDPDASNAPFLHWVIYDIPASSSELQEGLGSTAPERGPGMAKNNFGNTRYDGPQPPAGDGPHHYRFRLLALDVTRLDVAPRSAATDVVAVAVAHCLEETAIVGLFEVAVGASKDSVASRGKAREGIADADALGHTDAENEQAGYAVPTDDAEAARPDAHYRDRPTNDGTYGDASAEQAEAKP